MKKNKKKVLIICSVVAFLLLSGIIYFILNLDKKYSLTLAENKWIDANKYNVVDVAILNDIPILSYEGNGVIYNYLDDVTNNVGLKFNVIPYKIDGNIDYEYKMQLKSIPENGDIVLYEDNMVLLSSSDLNILNIDDINNYKIGVLTSDFNMISKYFVNKNINFIQYDDNVSLKKALIETSDSEKVDGIIITKALCMKEVINDKYNIEFQFNDLKQYFVLNANGSKELNSILNKSYNKWYESDFVENYNINLLESYYSFLKIADVEQKKLQSKNYVYGFINYGMFNYIEGNKISGFSAILLKDFNSFSNISIKYTQYNSIGKLLKDFNSGKVDFMLNIADQGSYINSYYETIGVYNEQLAIVSGKENNETIDSVLSLANKEISILKDSKIETKLINLGAKVKSYNNVKDLVKGFSSADIMIIDMENYNFYKSSYLKNCKINYLFDLEDKYNYIINNIDSNKEFINLFNFYLSFNSINKLISNNYNKVAYNNINVTLILILVIIVLLSYVIIDFSIHVRIMYKSVIKNKKIKLTKEEKIKYIDQLTSLKNRAYFNSKIELWDDSEVYPQAIIIIDLNNISYINDNYGREEGDKIITQAANILIMNQIENSEIIRTDGNEFLIYLVGYNEKQIINYIRKLNKELKNLEHGFGAASGYSIITDAIKTIDDAVNEATIEMKNAKEDIEY